MRVPVIIFRDTASLERLREKLKITHPTVYECNVHARAYAKAFRESNPGVETFEIVVNEEIIQTFLSIESIEFVP